VALNIIAQTLSISCLTGRIHSSVLEAIRVQVSDASLKTFRINGVSEQNVTFNYAVSRKMFKQIH
jgi:hypothetical protein